MIDNENRSVELSELIIATELSDLNSLVDINNLNDLILSISIYWYCEVSATWLIKKQTRDIELNLLLKMLNLSFSIDLIDDLIELYFFAFVSDVSTRIFLILWSTSAATKYFDFDESIETRILILDLINDVKFVSSAICEIFAFWLIEKQTRDVELNLLLKMLNLNFCWISKFDVSSIAICWCCEVFVVRLTEEQNRNVELSELIKTANLKNLNDRHDIKFKISSNAICEIFVFWLIEKQTRDVELKQLMKVLNLIDLIDVKFDWLTNLK